MIAQNRSVLFIFLFVLTICYPNKGLAQDDYNTLYNLYYSYVLPELSRDKQSLFDLQRSVTVFHNWQTQVENADLSSQFSGELLTISPREIATSTLNLATRKSLTCDGTLEENINEMLDLTEIVKWSRFQVEILISNKLVEIESTLNQIPICIQFKFELKSNIKVFYPPTRKEGTLRSSVNLSGEVSPTGELEITGRGEIDYNNLYFLPFSRHCSMKWDSSPSHIEILPSKITKDVVPFTMDKLELAFSPGHPIAYLFLTCDGVETTIPYDVWPPIWDELHSDEFDPDRAELVLKNWINISPETLKKQYSNRKGDVTENTEIKVFR